MLNPACDFVPPPRCQPQLMGMQRTDAAPEWQVESLWWLGEDLMGACSLEGPFEVSPPGRIRQQLFA